MQPSQMNLPSRVVSGRVSAAQFLSLEQELADRGVKRTQLVAQLVLTWLRAATGRGHVCTCPDCPGNLATMRRLGAVERDLLEEMSA
jgi:hypothetical protein